MFVFSLGDVVGHRELRDNFTALVGQRRRKSFHRATGPLEPLDFKFEVGGLALEDLLMHRDERRAVARTNEIKDGDAEDLLFGLCLDHFEACRIH